jgi:hypothetical protein
MSINEFISDKQVAKVAQVSVSYISALFRKGDKFVLSEGETDLRAAKPITLAGRRRWNPAKVAEILGLTTEQVKEILA